MLVWRGHSLRQPFGFAQGFGRTGRLCPRNLTRMRMRVPMMEMLMSHTLGMLMLVLMLLLPVLFSRRILLPVNVNIHLARGNSAAHHAGNLQPRTKIGRRFERRDGVLQQPWRHPRIHQRAEKHVAADAGKTFKVSNAHKIKIANHRGHRVSQGSASLTSVVKRFLRPRKETFIIGNPATSVKPALAACSVRITIFSIA